MSIADRIKGNNERIQRITKPKQFLNGWNKGATTNLVFKDSNSQRHTLELEFNWYFYVRTQDVINNRELFYRLVSNGLVYHTEKYPFDHDFMRVYCDNKNLYAYQLEQGELDPKTITLRKLREQGIQTYEDDVTTVKRLMLDHELKISSKYKILFWDLETQDETASGQRLPIDVGAYPIVSMSFETTQGKNFFLCHKIEEVILRDSMKFFDAADIICTYNGNRFDKPYIRDRCRLHNIWPDFKRLIHVDMFERIYDLYQFDQTIEQYGLDYISKHFLPGEAKIDHSGISVWKMYQNYLAGKDDLLRLYNCQDVRLLRLLNTKLHIIPFMIQLARATGSFLSQFHKSWLIDSFILKEGLIQGRPLPSKPINAIKVGKFDGALVLDPKPGKYKDVAVYDFKSLYPNIIRTWNIGMSTDTMLTEDDLEQLGQSWQELGLTKSATPHVVIYYDLNRESMLAHAVGLFLDGRASVRAVMSKLDQDDPEWRNLDLLQKVWKILANSAYGITASPKTRYFDKRVAESITHGGRTMLLMAVEWFEANDCTVLYGDTDSVFVQLHDQDKDWVMKSIHMFFERMLKLRWGVQKSTIELEFEKSYKTLVICGKKHYGGFLQGGKKDGTLNGMGLDFKKRSTVPMSRRFLKELIEKVNNTDYPAEYYANWLDKIHHKILKAPIKTKDLEQFSIQKKMTKEVSQFASNKALPIHAEVYLDLKAAGFEVPLPHVVRYVMVVPDGKRQGKKDAVAVDMFQRSGREIDRVSYWNTEIFGKIRRILEAVFPDYDWHRFDPIMVENRNKYYVVTLERLCATKNAPDWWKFFHGIKTSILSAEQKADILFESGAIEPMMMKEMQLKLQKWVRKRICLYVNPDEILMKCEKCSPSNLITHVKGLRNTIKYSYDSILCTNCGHEDSERREQKWQSALSDQVTSLTTPKR